MCEYFDIPKERYNIPCNPGEKSDKKLKEMMANPENKHENGGGIAAP